MTTAHYLKLPLIGGNVPPESRVSKGFFPLDPPAERNYSSPAVRMVRSTRKSALEFKFKFRARRRPTKVYAREGPK